MTINPITKYLALKVFELYKIGVALQTPPVIEDRPRPRTLPPRPYLKEEK